jgi:hypothetical protein
VWAASVIDAINAIRKQSILHPIPQSPPQSKLWVLPLMLAHETHDALLSAVAHTYAGHLWAFHPLRARGAPRDEGATALQILQKRPQLVQRLLGQYLYFCASKASKVSTYMGSMRTHILCGHIYIMRTHICSMRTHIAEYLRVGAAVYEHIYM